MERKPLAALAAALAAAALPSLSAAAAPGAHAEITTYFQSTLTQADYQQAAFTRVAKAFRQPGAKGLPEVGKKAVVQAVIARDGKLLRCELSAGSGAVAWDKAAVAAVKKAAPFGALPAGYEGASVEVHFHVAWVGR